MGAGWRRVSELAKQKFHITADKDFVPTPNSRNELMLKEAGEFAAHLKRCEQDIQLIKEATEGLVNTTKIVMSAPLPRVYEDAGNGKAQPVVPGNRPPGLIGGVGGDFNAEELSRVSKDTGKKLEAEVLLPMQRWATAYNTVESRMKKLEALRLEVDSRRRTVSQLGKRVEKQRAKLPQTRAKGELEMEGTIKTLQHKENKLSAARQSFKEHEVIVYQQLAQLIRDAVWLKSYIVAVMRLEQEAFSAAYMAVGPAHSGQVPMLQEGASMTSGMPPADMYGAAPGLEKGHPKLQRMGSVKADAPGLMAGPVPGKAGVEAYSFDAPTAPSHRYQSAAAQQQHISSGQYDRYSQQQSAW